MVDLRTLFMALGKEKNGLKKDLIRRAIQLIEDENSQELLSKINDIYKSRDHYRSKITKNTITPSTPSSPKEIGIKLMAFPFHQTLDTLIDLNALRPSTVEIISICYDSVSLGRCHFPRSIVKEAAKINMAYLTARRQPLW